MLSILLSLLSATSWGAGDFAGGLATRRLGTFKTVFFQEVIGLALLIPAVVAIREPVPPLRAWLFAFLAGIFGNLGLLVLYRALATGSMSIVAPVSALMTAALPVVVGSIAEGFPGPLVFLGFAFALAAMWLISQNEGHFKDIFSHVSDLRLPLFAGVGFGLFFVLIHEATRASTVWPMIGSRSAGLLVVVIVMLLRREKWSVDREVRPLVVLNGVLDIGGNAFYIVAGQLGRLDISAVISSLYPGATILLARLILKERLSRTQSIGIAAALVAIGLLAF